MLATGVSKTFRLNEVVSKQVVLALFSIRTKICSVVFVFEYGIVKLLALLSASSCEEWNVTENAVGS